MKQFSLFLKNLLKNVSADTVLLIRGKNRKIKALVHLTTKNYLKENGDYYKAVFDDGSFLLIMPHDQELYFAPKIIGHIKEIPDNDIGKKKIIEYKGKKYQLGNKDDYQFVLRLILGSPLDIEGECRFSDYFPTTGPKEFLSLGWLSKTGKRADINCQIIDLNDIKIDKN